MPYSNVPEHLWDKMDRCVKDVMDEQGVEKERAIAICHTSVVGKGRLLTMKMTKVQKKGNRFRWQARCNTGEFDIRQERFHESFFDDVVANFLRVQEAITKGTQPPADMPVPILDISHYSLYIPKSERDRAQLGFPTKLWRDGRDLFAQGYFDDTPLGQLAAKAAQERQPEDRRVSIVVFPDWSLVKRENERTVYYGEDGTGKAYLDSLAMTSMPCDPGTHLEVNAMKSLGIKDDALKVLGEEDETAAKFVEALEGLRSKSKSDAAPEGAVVKSEEKGEGEGKAETGEATPPSGGVGTGDVVEQGSGDDAPPAEEKEPEGKEKVEPEPAPESKSMVEIANAIVKGLLPTIAQAVDERLDEALKSVSDLPGRLTDIEAKVTALASDETAKLQAALDSQDGDWLTKAIQENSVQRGVKSDAAVKGDPVQETPPDSAYSKRFGNPDSG